MLSLCHREHSKKVAVCKPESEPSPRIPPYQLLSYRLSASISIRNKCCLSHSAYGILFWNPKLAKIAAQVSSTILSSCLDWDTIWLGGLVWARGSREPCRFFTQDLCNQCCFSSWQKRRVRKYFKGKRCIPFFSLTLTHKLRGSSLHSLLEEKLS